jgi:mono/diheme cytochrome c family protein
MKQHIKHHSITVAVVLAILVLGAGLFIFSGVYDLGADVHHSAPVLALMQTFRDRSIHARSKDIKVPNLEDPQLILNGAGHYTAMCTGCHLAPGIRDSEIRPGLYPEPPNLSQVRVEPQDAFWVIKHGIKMSAMPAWGLTHDDSTIWSMVAFLQTLPDMTPAQYKEIVAKAPPDKDMDMDMDEGGQHSHDKEEGDGDAHDTASAEGTGAPAKRHGARSGADAVEEKTHPR